MKKKKKWCGYLIAALSVFLFSGPPLVSEESIPTTREMNLMTWTEFQEIVPARIDTVLLPLGSIEPHGVIPSGTDSLAPTAMAVAIAARLNALIAPTLNYGVTPAMQAYPGSVSITAETYAPFVAQVMEGLADQRFLNIIVLNGHGGNTDTVKKVATRVSVEKRVRILVINWWSLADDITKEVFGENGGHAGNNETAYVQAVVPDHIHPERLCRPARQRGRPG